MEQIYRIRNMKKFEGKSMRKISQITGHDFETVKKYVEKDDFNQTISPKQKRQSKLSPYRNIVTTWLIKDKQAPHKQQHTARRVYDRLKELYGDEDISADIEITVHLLKNLSLEGPVIIPASKELNPRFRPFTDHEFEIGKKILEGYGADLSEKSYPIQIVGTGPNLNAAIDTAVHRASKLTGLSIGEIKNRGTVGGEVGIGRTSGCVYLTLILGESTLEQIGLLHLAKEQYKV